MSPSAALVLSAWLPCAQEPAPADAALDELVLEAERLQPLVRTDAGRELLEAVGYLTPAREAVVYRAPGGYLAAAYTQAEYDELPEAQRTGLSALPVDTRTWYHTFYGSPLAALRALDLAAEHGIDSWAGKRVLDFGFGSVGQLRLLAACGAEAVGTEVMPALRAIYAAPDAQGVVHGADGARGAVRLVFGRWPAEEDVVAAVAGGYDLFVSKNTIKRGYVAPPVEVDPSRRLDLGVPADVFLARLLDVLRPGGLAVLYNLGGRPAGEGEPYRPATDIACPWSRAELEAAGFEVLALDRDDSAAARVFGRALGWEAQMDLETALFGSVTVLKRP
jgi:hypothetical protein